jgi:hypothetical protein
VNIARLVGIIIYNKTQSDLEYFGRWAFGNETADGGRVGYIHTTPCEAKARLCSTKLGQMQDAKCSNSGPNIKSAF